MPIDFKTYLDNLNKTASRKYSAKEVLNIMPHSEFTNIPDIEEEEAVQQDYVTPKSTNSQLDRFLSKHSDRDPEILREGFNAIQERVKNRDGIRYGEPITADHLEELGRKRIEAQAPPLWKEGVKSFASGVVQLPAMAGKGLQWLDPDGGSNVVENAGQAMENFSNKYQEKFRDDIAPSKQAEISEWYSPRRMVAYGPENLVASAVPMVAGLGVGAVAGGAAGIAAGLGTLGTLFYGGSAEEKYRQAKEHGLDDDAAFTLANWEGGIEAGGEIIADLIPIGLIGKATARVQKGVIKSIAQGEGLKGVLKTIGTTMIGETATEVAQAAAQTAISNKMGVDVGGVGENVADVIAPTIFMSLVFGGVAGVARHQNLQQNKKAITETLSNPNATQENFDKALKMVVTAAKDIDKTAAKNFEKYAIKQREAGQPIVVKDDFDYLADKQKLAEWTQTGQKDGEEFTPDHAYSFIREKMQTGDFTDDDLQDIKKNTPVLADVVNRIDAERVVEKANQEERLIQESEIKQFDEEWNQRVQGLEQKKKERQSKVQLQEAQQKDIEVLKQKNLEYQEKLKNDPTFKARRKADAQIEKISTLDRAMDGQRISKDQRAIELMLEQSKNTQTRSNFYDEATGQRVQVPADSPSWMKEITTPAGLSREKIETLAVKYKEQILEGKPNPKNPIKDKQWEQIQSIIIPAIDKIKKEHENELYDQSDYEADGYKFVKKDTPVLALDFNIGDTLLDFNGIAGESEVIERNDSGIVIRTPDNQTHRIDDLDGLNITAFKDGDGTVKEVEGYTPPKTATPTVETPDTTDTPEITKLKERETRLIGEIENATDEDVIKKKQARLEKLQGFIDKAQSTVETETTEEMPTIEGLRQKLVGYREREQELQTKIDNAKDDTTKEHLNKNLKRVQGKIAAIEPEKPADDDIITDDNAYSLYLDLDEQEPQDIRSKYKPAFADKQIRYSQLDAIDNDIRKMMSEGKSVEDVATHYRSDFESKKDIRNDEKNRLLTNYSIGRAKEIFKENPPAVSENLTNQAGIVDDSKVEEVAPEDNKPNIKYANKAFENLANTPDAFYDYKNDSYKQEVVKEAKRYLEENQQGYEDTKELLQNNKDLQNDDGLLSIVNDYESHKKIYDDFIAKAQAPHQPQAKEAWQMTREEYEKTPHIGQYYYTYDKGKKRNLGEFVRVEGDEYVIYSKNNPKGYQWRKEKISDINKYFEQGVVFNDLKEKYENPNLLLDTKKTNIHKKFIQQALKSKQLTPERAEELGHFKTYPDLQEKYGKPAQPQGTEKVETETVNGLLEPLPEGYSKQFFDGWDKAEGKTAPNKSFAAVERLFGDGYITKEQRDSVSPEQGRFTPEAHKNRVDAIKSWLNAGKADEQQENIITAEYIHDVASTLNFPDIGNWRGLTEGSYNAIQRLKENGMMKESAATALLDIPNKSSQKEHQKRIEAIDFLYNFQKARKQAMGNIVGQEAETPKADTKDKLLGNNPDGNPVYESAANGNRYYIEKGRRFNAPMVVGMNRETGVSGQPYSAQELYRDGRAGHLTDKEYNEFESAKTKADTKPKSNKEEFSPENLLAEWDRQVAEREAESKTKQTSEAKTVDKIHLKTLNEIYRDKDFNNISEITSHYRKGNNKIFDQTYGKDEQYYKAIISNALGNNVYEEAIKNGEITFDKVSQILSEAGFILSANKERSLKQASSAPETPTENLKQQIKDKYGDNPNIIVGSVPKVEQPKKPSRAKSNDGIDVAKIKASLEESGWTPNSEDRTPEQQAKLNQTIESKFGSHPVFQELAAAKKAETKQHISNALEKFKQINNLLGERGSFSTEKADENIYAQMKVLLQEALDEIILAGQSAKEYVKLALDNLTPKGRPYLEKFVNEDMVVKSIDQIEKEKQDGSINNDDGKNRSSQENDKGSIEGKSPEDVSTTDAAGTTPNVSEPEGKGNDGGLRTGERSSNGQVAQDKKRQVTNRGRSRTGNDVASSVGRDDVESSGVPRRNRGNDHRIEQGDLERTGSWLSTAKSNLDAIELYKKITEENRQATPEEQKILAKYVGWGSSELANNMFPAYSQLKKVNPEWARSPEWKAQVERLVEVLTPEEIQTAVRSTQYAHYTSEKVVRSIYKALDGMGFKGGKILEPGMGVGNFVGLLPDNMLKNTVYTGIEMDHITAGIAKLLYPNQNILQADFTKQTLPKNFFDAAIGNPPFGNIKILSDPEYSKQSFTLHNYFFAKSIDRVRPGGLLVFVTSRYTMDSQKDIARKYLSDRADLLGAIRLPQTAFKQNAGTDVVTDVLFLRKREDGAKPSGQAWTSTSPISLKENDSENNKEVQINEYFASHPEMVLGEHSLAGKMYSKNEYTVTPIEGEIEELFAKAVEKLPKNVYSKTTAKTKAVHNVQTVIERDFNPKNKKEGGLYLADDGNLMKVDFGSGVPLDSIKKVTEKQQAMLKDYIKLRDKLKLSNLAQLNEGDWQTALKDLNKEYDKFVKRHGNLNEYTSVVKTQINEDGVEEKIELRKYKYSDLLKRSDVEAPLVLALEKINDEGQIVKATGLTDRVINRPSIPEIKSIPDALAVSLDNLGVLDLDHVAKLINRPVQEVIDTLGDLLYISPSNSQYVLADEYLSGDVVAKLEEAEIAAESDPKYKRNVEALKAVQPEPLTTADITVLAGSTWIPEPYYNEFAAEVLEMNTPRISYDNRIGSWTIAGNFSEQQYRGSSEEWSHETRGKNEILDAIMNNRGLRITYTVEEDGVRKTVFDQESTAAVNEIAKKMRGKFSSWVWQDVKRANTLLDIYNRQFNNLAPRKIDGSHLTLPGISSRFKLYSHQKDAIWRILQTGNTYLNHAVGAGKTYTMIAAGMEMKRLGMVKKPMYVVPKHMLEQFSQEFQELYPMATIMVADEDNFHTHNRKRFVAQATMNNPDAIIITHSSFGLIKSQEENIAPVRDEFIGNMQLALEDMRDEDAPKMKIKKMEKMIEQAEQRFDSLIGTGDNVVSFEEMGVDFLFIDEAHEFRKLDFATNRQVKGIDTKGSKKAIDLYIKTLFLDGMNKGRSHVFASGTPIVNTIGEMYSILRFFDNEGLRRDNIQHFDAWANMFGEVNSDYEMNSAGRFEIVERFSKFVNIPEMMSRVRQFTDVLTNKQLGDRVDRPTIKGGSPEIVLAPKSADLKNFQDTVLQPRIENSKAWKPSKDEPGNPDPLINIITDGRLASIDLRFVDTNAKNNPNSKLNKYIDGIIDSYKETKNNEYFIRGTDKKSPVKGGSIICFYNVGFGKSVATTRGFDARKWAMKRFKEAGIPENHIAWIDDYDTAAKKQALFKQVREGQKRIMLGSAKKMGTGVNAQTRLTHLHYLDAPWFPADVEQPDGRIVRQGNQNKEVTIKRYATEGSYDSTMWQMVARKSQFIEQAWTGEKGVRTLEDVSEASQYAMASALASGDQRMIQLVGLQADVERLQKLRSAHNETQQHLSFDKRAIEQSLREDKKKLQRYKEAQKKYPVYIGSNNFVGTVNGKSFDKRNEFNEALKDAFKKEFLQKGKNKYQDKYRKTQEQWTEYPFNADINGAKIGVKIYAPNPDALQGIIFIKFTDDLGSNHLEAFPEKQNVINPLSIDEIFDSVNIGTRVVNAINSISSEVSTKEKDINNKTAELGRITKRLGSPFEYEREYTEKYKELRDLEAELAAEGQETPTPAPENPNTTTLDVSQVSDTEKKEDWQMTFKEWDDAGGEGNHKRIVSRALSEGKPVPAEVLAGYPDLQATTGGEAQYSKASPAKPVKPATPASLDELPRRQRKIADSLIKQGTLNPLTNAQALNLLQQSGEALYSAAWHGSPHDHDGFDMSKVGSGEGAQVYGYGLYFATSKKIAQWYRNVLSPAKISVASTTINGKNFDINSVKDEIVKEDLQYVLTEAIQWAYDDIQTSLDGAMEAVIEYTKNQINNGEGEAKALQDRIKEAQFLKDNLKIKLKKEYSGKLYKVDIAPTEDEMLYLDGDFHAQSDKIRNLLAKDWGYDSRLKGRQIYQKLSKKLGSDKAASEHLLSLGIRGNKYLDGTSRGKGRGNYNYVIFNDKDVTIEAKYSKDGLIQAFVLNGKAYIVPENIESGKMWNVIRHDVGTHIGQLLQNDPEFNRLKNRVKLRRDEQSPTGEAIRKAYSRAEAADTNPEFMEEEVLGYLVEDSPDVSIARKLIALIKKYLAKIGIHYDLTQADMVALADIAVRREVNRRDKNRQQGEAKFAKAEGKPLNTDTPAFRDWFKNSKVVDKDGKPLVVHHGSPDVRGIFNNGGFKAGSRGDVWFAAKDYDVANSYTDEKRAYDYQNAEGQVIPLYISMQNPLEIDAKGQNWRDTEKYVKEAKAKGHDGIIIRNSMDYYNNPKSGGKSTTVYAWFNPTQAKSAVQEQLKSRYDGKPISGATGNIGTFDSTNPDIRFSIAPAAAQAQPFSIPDEMNLLDSFKDNYVNQLMSVKKAQDAMGGVSPEADLFTKESLRLAKAADEIKDGIERHINPMLKLMADSKFTIDNVNEYVYSRHAQEANERLKYTTAKEWLLRLAKIRNDGEIEEAIETIEKNYNDAVKKLNKLIKKQSKADVEEEIQELELWLKDNEPKNAFFDELLTQFAPDKIDGEQEITLHNKWLEFIEKPSGMTNDEAQKLQDKWKQHPNYKQMKKIAEYFDAMNREKLKISYEAGRMTKNEYAAISKTFQYYAPLHREGFEDSTRGYGSGLRNLGKDTMARGGSIKRAVDMLQYAINDYQLTILKAHKAESTTAFKNFVDSLPEGSNFIEYIKAPTKAEYDRSGNIRHVLSHNLQSNEVDFKVDGELYIARANPNNEYARRIIEQIKENPEKTGVLVKALSKFNRVLAMVNTSLSPEFLFTNFIKDLEAASINLQATEISNMTKQVVKDLPAVMNGLHNYMRGNKSHKLTPIIKRYFASGASVGWLDSIGTIEEKTQKLQDELDKLKPLSEVQGNKQKVKIASKKLWDRTGAILMDYNSVVENALRVSAFKSALDAGVSEEQAAMLAKNLTVNFNAKGLHGQVMNSLYLFSNAGIQGSAKVISVLMKSKKARQIIGASVGLSVGLAIANSMIGGDDDDGVSYYEKIDDFQKQRNIIFMLPNGKGKYVSIPLPWGYNVFWKLGEEVGTAIATWDRYKPLDGVSRMITTTLNAFNPLQSGTLLQTVTPTILDPLASWGENKNWSGSPLMPEQNQFSKYPEPNSQRFFPSARKLSVDIAQGLNSLTGGNEIKSGLVDISPETLDLVWDTFTGSAGKFVANTVNVPVKMLAGEELSNREIPFYRRFVGEKSDYVDEQIFRKNVSHIYQLHDQAEKYPERAREFKKDKAYYLLNNLQAVEKRLRRLYKKRKALTAKEDIDRIQETINNTKMKFNTLYNKSF